MRMVLANQPYFAPKTSFTPDRNEKYIIPKALKQAASTNIFAISQTDPRAQAGKRPLRARSNFAKGAETP